ncbi:MAG: hypothetical protein ACRD3Y_10685, partial [Bryobacteraceae bacterium]
MYTYLHARARAAPAGDGEVGIDAPRALLHAEEPKAAARRGGVETAAIVFHKHVQGGALVMRGDADGGGAGVLN